jgi:mono/diheme cytochrome c family protein
MWMDSGAGLVVRGGCTLSALTAVLLLSVTPAAAGTDEEYHPGRDLYMKYCQSCHGRNARGAGPVATELDTPPPDLTKLAGRAGGTFPFLRTMEWIDGTARVTAHGKPEMPVWGERFRAEAPPGMNAEARGKLLWITEYLRTIQD